MVDGSDEVVKRVLTHIHKIGLRAVPGYDTLSQYEQKRIDKVLEVPVVDWEVMGEHLPASWRKDWYFPSLPSSTEVAAAVAPVAIGVSYGFARSFIGMGHAYTGSQALQAMGLKWRVLTALRCGGRTGIAVLVMGVGPEVCRWLTCHTQKYLSTPKQVVAASIAQGVAVLGAGAYMLRNCHYWFIPFVLSYEGPKSVIEDLLIKLRD